MELVFVLLSSAMAKDPSPPLFSSGLPLNRCLWRKKGRAASCEGEGKGLAAWKERSVLRNKKKAICREKEGKGRSRPRGRRERRRHESPKLLPLCWESNTTSVRLN